MKKYLFTIAAAVAAIFAASCEQEDVIKDSITLSTDKTIAASWEGSVEDIVFTANVAWTAEVQGGAFLSLDKTSGEAGTVTLKLTVAKNEADANRSATVVLTAGTASETITVNQEAVGATSEDDAKTIDFLAQTVAYEVSGTPSSATSDADWLTVTVDGKVVNLAATENEGTEPRVAHVAIVIVKHTINLTVTQEPESGDLSNVKASYLGNKALIYNDETWSYTTFGQYKLEFDSEYGNVVLVINVDPSEGDIDPTTVPTGVFAVDAAGTFADQTFTVAGENATLFTIGSTVYNVVDGEIEITKEGSDYTVKATLQEESEKLHVFTYTGAIAEVVKDDLGSNVESAPTYSNYYTYFAGNNFIWTVTLFYSAAPSADSEYVSYVTFRLITAGEASEEFPTGTFNYAPINTSYVSPNGTLETTIGTFDISGNTLAQDGVRLNSGQLVVSKDDEGKYTFAITSNLTSYTNYDADGNWQSDPIDLKSFDWNITTSFDLPKSVAGQMAVPDTDEYTFTQPLGQYVGYWIGHIYGENPEGDGGNPDWNAFFFGWTTAEGHVIYLSVNTALEWVWEVNFANRYCNTPIPAATYTFSNEAAANTLLPTKSRCYIQNSYTGTSYRINGGSITLTDSTISFNDLTGMDSKGNVCTFKADALAASCYYIRQGTSASYVAAMEIVPVVAPGN